MDPIGTLAVALTGVAMVGGWIVLTGPGSTSKAPRKASGPAKPAINGWTRKPSTVGLPKVSRRGFGSNLARTPARARRWSPYVYRTMWAGLHR